MAMRVGRMVDLIEGILEYKSVGLFLQRAEITIWARLFEKPLPETRPNYYTDDIGSVEWDYEDQCNSWDNLKEMYAYRKVRWGR